MRTLSGWVVVASSMAMLGMSGCGSNSDPVSGPQYAYPDVTSYCAARAKAECSAVVLDSCQSAETSCMTTRQGLCGQSVPPGAKYRPAQADACIAAVAAAYTDDKFTAAERDAIDEACSKLFEGLGEKGSTCSSNTDCNLDAQLECVKPTGADTGTCQVPDLKQPGDPCSAADAVCKEGYFCTSSTPKTCAKKLPSGEACNDVLPCDDTLRCVPTAPPATDGLCEPKLPIQSSCQVDDDCADGFCLQIAGELKCASSIKLSPNEPACADFR
jgi:hypothetical protein